MHRLAILFCAIAPCVVLLQYGIAKARARWDDLLIWEAFYTGGIAAVFALFPELLLKNMLSTAAMPPAHGAVTEAFAIAAIPEEIAKFAAIFYVIRRYHAGADRADQPDMITLSFAVALGFAAIENLSYLLAFGDWALLAASRALTAVPVHGLNGLAMGSFLAAAQLHPRNRHLWLTFALVVPVLLHAVYDFPLILVARNQMFFGVLPAWFLFIVLCSVCILWLSNNVRASVERAKGLFDATSTAWRTGVMLLLLVPALSAVALVGAGDFGILDAAACSILPVIFGVDLLYTRPKVSRATTAKL